MTASLSLMKIVLTSLAKSALLPLRLSEGMSAAYELFKKKKKSWIRNYSINNFKWRNGRYNENS